MHTLRYLILLTSLAAFAQNQPEPNENGAVALYFDSGGWSFGLPAVRAAASIPGVGSAISPEKKTLYAPGFGVRVTAWKFLVPFFDVVVYDTGKATATVGPLTSEVEADTLSFNGGVRLVAGKSSVRGYVQFGGGVLYQDLKGNFIVAGRATPVGESGSIGTFTYGGGFQVFAGRKWGLDTGFDGYRVAQPLLGAGQNYGRFRVGMFYQTKSTVQ